QDDWLGIAYRYLEKDAPRFALDPVPEQLKALVKLGGIANQFQELGMSDAEIDHCLSDPKRLQQTVQVAAAGSKLIKGTPTFFVNGTRVPP
ncbi:hypothetical protein ABI049_15400, partial [Enterococcus faecium]|uniref:DsbA family protein n=1 Tax=Enterococcus faecium TaxID=1352 RepID=UPI003F44078C